MFLTIQVINLHGTNVKEVQFLVMSKQPYIVSGTTPGIEDEELELQGTTPTFPQTTKLSHSKPCWSMISTD